MLLIDGSDLKDVLSRLLGLVIFLRGQLQERERFS